PNAALRFKPTREQMQAIREEMGGGSGGSGGSGRRGNRGSGGGSDGGGSGSRQRGSDARSGASGGGMKRDFGDKKPVYKLVDGRPKIVLIKPGLTDGSSTEMVEGDLVPGDQLVTEINGVAAPARRVGAFWCPAIP